MLELSRATVAPSMTALLASVAATALALGAPAPAHAQSTGAAAPPPGSAGAPPPSSTPTEALATSATHDVTPPAGSNTGGQRTGGALQEVVVTARRSSENLQRVPVAVTVLSQAVFDARGAFTPQDLTTQVPGLSVNASIQSRDNLTYNIRGQGFSYGTLFPAVVTYFNEVPITQLGTGQFFDLADVQVLRGPQGVLFGRVTDGGNVMVQPRRPGADFDGYVEARVGDYGLHDFTGAVNVPVVQDKLLVRAAFDVNRRDGFTTNVYNGEDLDDVAYESVRFGVTWRPIAKLENYTVVNYEHVHNNGTGTVLGFVNPVAVANTTAGLFPLVTGAYGINGQGNVVPYQAGLTPLTSASYLASLQGRLAHQQALGPRKVDYTSASYDRRDDLYVVNTTSYDLTKDIQLKNVLGYTNVDDRNASNYAGANGSYELTCHATCPNGGNLPYTSQEQFSEEFRIAGKAFNRRLSWSVGTYWDFQHPGEAFENDTYTVAVLQYDNVQYTQTASAAGFGYAEYNASDVLPGLKFNAGVRYTKDRVKSSEATYEQFLPAPGVLPALSAALGPDLAAATVNGSIPHGQCRAYSGGIFSAPCTIYKADFSAVTYTGGASYQIGPRQLSYAKVSRGYRPGGVNNDEPPGLSALYQPEYDLSVEIGLKSDWSFGDVKLRTDIAAYHDDYSNIQKSISVLQGAPVTIVANVAGATVQGVEFEGTLIPVRGLVIGLNYSLTDAEYDKSKPYNPSSCDPTALVAIGFCPYNRFSFTPKDQAGLIVHYTLPLDAGIGDITVGGNYYYQSSEALYDQSVLAPYVIEPGHGTLDLDATWHGIYGRPVDLTFFMTNVTDKLYRIGDDDLTQNSSLGIGANIYAPPRMFGFGLKYRFGAHSRS